MITFNWKSMFLLILIFFAGVCCEKSYAQSSVSNYELDYRFDFKQEKFFGKATISLKGRSDTLSFILYRLLKVRSVTDQQGNSLAFRQEVVAMEDWDIQQVNHLEIYPKAEGDAPLGALTIEYDGYMNGYTETGMRYTMDKISPAFTILRPDCYAYPVLGVPNSIKIGASFNSKFSYTVAATVPDTLVAVNLGALITKERIGDSFRYTYRNTVPAWRIDMMVGKYSTLTSGGVAVHYFPADSVGARRVALEVGRCKDLYANWFGAKNISGYSIVEIPNGYGSQADVSGIIQVASAFTNSANMPELYHEISHLWNITCTDSNPCRLESEGLAMVLQSLVEERLSNKKGVLDAAAVRMLKSVRRELKAAPEAAAIPIADYGKKGYTEFSYSKGMLFFYLLYKIVGENDFMATIKGFYSTYGMSGATTKQFTDYLNHTLKAYPKVKTLVDDWVYSNAASKHIMESNDIRELLAK
jgi:hypothetical protein